MDALYNDFLRRGIRHFFPRHRLESIGPSEHTAPTLEFHHQTDGSVEFDWCGARYGFSAANISITEDELRLLGAIGDVLSARYRSIFLTGQPAATLEMFRGLPEDRFVSAFLDHRPYIDPESIPNEADVIAGAIEVLRESSLITYENRRISTGALLMGPGEDPVHPHRAPPLEALPYNRELVGIKSFHRLCDGINTVFQVSREGLLLDLIDIHAWNKAACERSLPAPTGARYHCHSVATLGGHLSLVLTPNGEIKIFAQGSQVFSFLGGRWRLTDMAEKYHRWHRAVGDGPLAERMFVAALNLAENRRGGLFVILDDPASADHLVANADRLDQLPAPLSAPPYSKDQVHYLLRHKRVLDLEPSLLESIARMDGAIVLDRAGNLLAFGAILRNDGCGLNPASAEGGRTTAAMAASEFGNVLKISEDGVVTYYREGRPVWEI